MKKANINMALVIMVGVVIVLGLALIMSNTNNLTTDYSSSTGAVALAPGTEECETSADCQSSEYCDPNQQIGCSFGSCVCIDPCMEGASCFPGGEDGNVVCGGITGDPLIPPTGNCFPTNPFVFEFSVQNDGEGGACDCDNDGCTAGASCTVITVDSSLADTCGPTGYCQPISGNGEGSGTEDGICVCGEKPCQVIDAEGFEGETDKCLGTQQCESGVKCKTHNDCGGVGLGQCLETKNGKKQCSCDPGCVSWAPCESDDDCGDFGGEGEGDGSFGRCITGFDGVKECMCADDFGCSQIQCEIGQPCTGEGADCGGFGDNCNDGVCEDCGYDCEFFCQGGACEENEGDLTKEACDDLAEQLGSDIGCKLDEFGNCDCEDIAFDLCRRTYSAGGSDVLGE